MKKDSYWNIRKDSFNIVFQGNPWWAPGLGPLATVPVNEIVMRTDLIKEADTNPILGWILPFGPTADNPVRQFMPKWMKSAQAAVGWDKQAYAQMYLTTYGERKAKFNEDPDHNTDPDTVKGQSQVKTEVRNKLFQLFLFAEAAPVSISPSMSPKLNFYVEQMKRMKDDYYKDPTAYKAAHNGAD